MQSHAAQFMVESIADSLYHFEPRVVCLYLFFGTAGNCRVLEGIQIQTVCISRVNRGTGEFGC